MQILKSVKWVYNYFWMLCSQTTKSHFSYCFCIIHIILLMNIDEPPTCKIAFREQSTYRTPPYQNIKNCKSFFGEKWRKICILSTQKLNSLILGQTPSVRLNSNFCNLLGRPTYWKLFQLWWWNLLVICSVSYLLSIFQAYHFSFPHPH